MAVSKVYLSVFLRVFSCVSKVFSWVLYCAYGASPLWIVFSCVCMVFSWGCWVFSCMFSVYFAQMEFAVLLRYLAVSVGCLAVCIMCLAVFVWY